MQGDRAASIIYLTTAVAGSLYTISSDNTSPWLAFSISWLCVAAAPLLFVFAYPRCLPTGEDSRRRLKYGLIFHIVGVAFTVFLFSVFSPFWKNPVRDLGESLLVLLVPLAVLVVFLVAAISLLLRRKSALATLASVLIWPYWLVLALGCEDHWYRDSGIYAVCFFLCFLSPIFFAFAAGAVTWSPKFAHVTALLGVLAIPSLYWKLRDNGMGNIWVVFNQPDNRFAFYPPYAVFAICFVALLALATVTAVLRLLPSRWLVRGFPVSDRTWPAFLVSFAVTTAWFCQSVMPYRIPGAMDYSEWPVLQILRVQKRGLQFHEACVSVGGHRLRSDYYLLRSVRFSRNDRRLLQYRFKEKLASGQLSEAIASRVKAMLTASNQPHPTWPPVKPIRSWNADDWYVIVAGAGLTEYTTENRSRPPQEIVDLFDELEKLPHSSEGQSESKDVCLGFCYDPLSQMGYLYANHRCRNDGHGTVCR